MVSTECHQQLELFEVGRQVVTVDFEGGDVVSDAGLLPIRQLDQQLGILTEAARRLPDLRLPLLMTHSVESLLSQRVYQILAGYPDGNDAKLLKHDPLFKTCAGKSPSSQQPLVSGSTWNRFLHAYTRREAQKPLEDRRTLFECRDAQLQRIRGLNEFLVDVFARTRKKVRGDCGAASPEMYEFCEAELLMYTFSYASNEVLKRRVAESEHEANLL